MTHNQKIGKQGEELATGYLTEQGYVIIDRNVHTPYGEIDIIARKDQQLVFFEVKTRTQKRFGNPEDAIGEIKQKHLYDSAMHILQEHPDWQDDWRIDVLALAYTANRDTPEIYHFENAI